MSSQRNIDSLFRVQKPLVKRVRHTSGKDSSSDEISGSSAAALQNTPPPPSSKARRLSLTSTPSSSSKRKVRISLSSSRETAVPCTPPPPSTASIAPPAAVTPTPKSVKSSKRVVAKAKTNNNNVKGVRPFKLSTPSSTRSCRRMQQQTLIPRPSPRSVAEEKNPVLQTPPLRMLRRSPRFAAAIEEEDRDEQGLVAATVADSGPVLVRRPSRRDNNTESDHRRHEDEEIGPSHSTPGNSHDVVDEDINAADAKDEIGSVIDEDEDDEDEDDEDEEIECVVRDDRLITPRSDPLLDHILDTFVDNPTV